MLRVRDRALAAGLLLGLAVPGFDGCRREPSADEARARAEGRNPDGTSSRSRDDRIPAYTDGRAGETLGAQPGYLAGALLYATAEAELVEALLPILPLTTGDARELERLSATMSGDLLAELGVDPRARVSLSLRALHDHTGLHLRAHVPVATPELLEAALTRVVGGHEAGSSGARICATLDPSALCLASPAASLLVRASEGGFWADLLLTEPGSIGEPIQAALLREAVALPGGISLPEVEVLRGNATLLIHGPRTIAGLRSLARAHELAELDEALGRLHETERLFAGVSLELARTEDGLLARGRWLPTAAGREQLSAVFELDPVDADVPSVAALCRDAMICGRSRGLPARERFAGLASGVYGDPEALAALLDEHRELAALVLALETWPNAIASTALLPGSLVEPPESLFVRNALEVGGRILGFGFALGSGSGSGSGSGELDEWVAYARLSGPDLDTLGGFLQLADAPLRAIALAEVEGRVARTSSPIRALPGQLYAVHDPPAGSGQWGWAVLADGDARVERLAGLDHDDGAVPIAYLEVPELGRLLASRPRLRDTLGPAAPWLRGRWARAQLSPGPGGAPELRLAVGLTPDAGP